MASNKRAWAECDICGFRYHHREMKFNSYGMLVCPNDWDGLFDLKNHPQNRHGDNRDNETIIDPRPDLGDQYVPVTVTDWLPK